MISEADFYGNAIYQSVSSDVKIVPLAYRCWRLSPTGSGKTATLQDARQLQLGGPIVVIRNESATNSIAIRDAAGTTIYTLPANSTAALWLFKNDSVAGKWRASIRDHASFGRSFMQEARAEIEGTTTPTVPTPKCLLFVLLPCNPANQAIYTQVDLSAFINRVIVYGGNSYVVKRKYATDWFGTTIDVGTITESFANCAAVGPGGCTGATFPCINLPTREEVIDCLTPIGMENPARADWLLALYDGDPQTSTHEWLSNKLGISCICQPGCDSPGCWTDGYGATYCWTPLGYGYSCGDGTTTCYGMVITRT